MEWSIIFDLYSIGTEKTDLTKRVNTKNAVRQSSRDSAIKTNDNNFVT